jgi:hypothetical protein
MGGERDRQEARPVGGCLHGSRSCPAWGSRFGYTPGCGAWDQGRLWGTTCVAMKAKNMALASRVQRWKTS